MQLLQFQFQAVVTAIQPFSAVLSGHVPKVLCTLFPLIVLDVDYSGKMERQFVPYASQRHCFHNQPYI